jgi:hypothetical protein
VTLEENIREDDAALTIAAINRIKGVIGICPITADPMLVVAEERVRHQFMDKLRELFE